MKLTEQKKMILIHIAWILALAVILWPLFTIAKYDYPSADDWSFGKYMYRAMQAGEGIVGVFHAIYQTLAQNVTLVQVCYKFFNTTFIVEYMLMDFFLTKIS